MMTRLASIQIQIAGVEISHVTSALFIMDGSKESRIKLVTSVLFDRELVIDMAKKTKEDLRRANAEYDDQANLLYSRYL